MWAPAILAFSFQKQQQSTSQKYKVDEIQSCNLFFFCENARPQTFNSIDEFAKVIHKNPVANDGNYFKSLLMSILLLFEC